MPVPDVPRFGEFSSRLLRADRAPTWHEDFEHGAFDPLDVCGIVLVGSQTWGDGRFERTLRGPLLPVAQTPLICYSLDWLRLGGVESAIVCAGSANAAVRDYLGHGAEVGIHVDYSEDTLPRGPAGCAHDAARRSGASVFVVVEGCMIPTLDLTALLRQHQHSGAAVTVVVEIERRARAGGHPGPRQPGGIYLIDRRVLEGIPEVGYHDIKQGMLERLYAAGERVVTHEVLGIAPRVLDSATYASVDRWLITEEIRNPRFLADYISVGEGLHHPTAMVHPTARIVGPVLIGRDVVVEENAVLVGPMSVGRGTMIARDAVISRSCIWEQCVIGEDAHVDASLLTTEAEVTAGTRISARVHLPTSTLGPPIPSRVARASRWKTFPARPIERSSTSDVAVSPPSDFRLGGIVTREAYVEQGSRHTAR